MRYFTVNRDTLVERAFHQSYQEFHCTWDDLIPVSKVQAEADKSLIPENISEEKDRLTAAEFEKRFEMSAEHFFYFPSLFVPFLYCDFKHLIAHPLISLLGTKQFLADLEQQREEAKNLDFRTSLKLLPYALRQKFFDEVQKQHGMFPGIYTLFLLSQADARYKWGPQGFRTFERHRTEEEKMEVLSRVASLPPKITVFYGADEHVVQPENAVFWTRSQEVARYLACRDKGQSPYIVAAVVGVENVFDYLNHGNYEGHAAVLLDPHKVKIVNKVSLTKQT